MRRPETIIIGGSGFVGAFLVRRLTGKGPLRVISHSRVPRKARVAGVAYSVADLTKKSPLLVRLIRTARRLAIMTQPDARITKSISEAIVSAPQLERVLYTSSVLIYPSSAKGNAESSRARPNSLYEKGKWREEQELKRICAHNRIPLCIARLANVYGGVQNRGIVRVLFRAAIDGSAVTLNGGGVQERDYIFVDDVARALASLFVRKQTEPVRVVNISTNRPTSIRQLKAHIERVVGQKIESTDGPEVRGDKARVVASNARLCNLMPEFRPVSVEAGLKRTYRRIKLGI